MPVTAEARSGFLLPRLQLMRLPNAVTAGADVLAGAALAGVPAGRLPPLLLAALLLYAGGCVLNDLRDRHDDRLKHPQRPLPTGAVSAAEAAWLSALLLAAGVATAAAAGVRPALAATTLLGLVLLYDLAAKRHPLAGPLVMGSCRAGALLLGMSAGPSPPAATLLFPAALLLYVFALSRLAHWEQSRQRPPLFTAAPSLATFVLLAAGALLVPGFSLTAAIPFYLLALLVATAAWRKGLFPSRPQAIGAAVGLLIISLPLLAAFAAAGAAGPLHGAAAAACALPPLLARRRFYLT